ncbi:MAG: chorismate mutase [Candidatus Gracilibacteria bacterium]|nr:chorismate mutase [Candidatus Gracilibacteria bacterium]
MTFSEKIIPLRKDIDELDRELLKILKRRFKVVQKVGKLKKEYNIKPLDEARWQEVIKNIRNKAEDEKINPDFIEDLWNLIHKEALKLEE